MKSNMGISSGVRIGRGVWPSTANITQARIASVSDVCVPAIENVEKKRKHPRKNINTAVTRVWAAGPSPLLPLADRRSFLQFTEHLIHCFGITFVQASHELEV